jgi:hypothetical protein
MRKRSGPDLELAVELDDADDLFAESAPHVADGRPGRPAGIDKIREELDARSLPATLAAVIVLPAAKANPDLSRHIARAVERYCEQGIARAEREIRMLRREGFRTLLIGLSLFVAFVAIAEAIELTSLPSPLRNFLGADGLFIVIGWVGLWFPIETLLYSWRPYRREIAILRVIRGMRIEVAAAGSPRVSRAATGTGRGT